ncbi:hypothetical protein ACP4OV_009868 [Aristida adscensionis]
MAFEVADGRESMASFEVAGVSESVAVVVAAGAESVALEVAVDAESVAFEVTSGSAGCLQELRGADVHDFLCLWESTR